MEINYTLVSCPTRDDAGRLQEYLESMGIELDVSLIGLWEIFRKDTVFSIHHNKIEHQTSNYYLMKAEYKGWKFYSSDEFIGGERIKKKDIFRAMTIAIIFGAGLVATIVLMAIILWWLYSSFAEWGCFAFVVFALGFCVYLFYKYLI